MVAEGCRVIDFLAVPPNDSAQAPTFRLPPAATLALESTKVTLFAVVFALMVAEAEWNESSPSIVTLPSSAMVAALKSRMPWPLIVPTECLKLPDTRLRRAATLMDPKLSAGGQAQRAVVDVHHAAGLVREWHGDDRMEEEFFETMPAL